MTIEELEKKISELTAEERYDLVYKALFSNNIHLEKETKLCTFLHHHFAMIFQENRIQAGFENAQEMGFKSALRIVFNSQFGANSPDKSGMPKFKRFLVFVGEDNYGIGMETYQGSYNTFEEAREGAEYGLANAMFHSDLLLDQIYDSWMEKIVWKNGKKAE